MIVCFIMCLHAQPDPKLEEHYAHLLCRTMLAPVSHNRRRPAQCGYGLRDTDVDFNDVEHY